MIWFISILGGLMLLGALAKLIRLARQNYAPVQYTAVDTAVAFVIQLGLGLWAMYLVFIR